MTFHEAVDWVLLEKLLFGLAIGGLIGLERERHRDHRQVFAGVRTYPLVAVVGVLLTEISRRLDEPVFIAIGTALAGAFALFLFHVRHEKGQTGFTSPFAMIVTYLIGVLVGFGLLIEAVVAGVATTALLFTRERLHTIAGAMSEAEMRGALYFIAIAFILFPLSPDEPVDPWGVLNPRQILLIVVLVSALSFAGFLAMRYWGVKRGLPLSGALGGLVNSEAATTSAAQVSKERSDLAGLATRAIMLATATMFVRNIAIAVIADPGLRLATYLAVPLLAMAALTATWAFLRPAGAAEVKEGKGIRLPTPFAIKPAVFFGGVFALVSLLAYALTQIPGLGENGVYLTAAAGAVNAGAVVASMATLAAAGQIPIPTAGATAVLAVVLSTLNKPVIAGAVDKTLAKKLWPAAAAAAILGLAALAATAWAGP